MLELGGIDNCFVVMSRFPDVNFTNDEVFIRSLEIESVYVKIVDSMDVYYRTCRTKAQFPRYVVKDYV